MTAHLLPKLDALPNSLPLEGAVRIELVEGVPVFRASSQVQIRIEALLDKQKITTLDSNEEQELSSYEELDDYLSLVNRIIRQELQLKPSVTAAVSQDFPLAGSILYYDDPFGPAVDPDDWGALQ